MNDNLIYPLPINEGQPGLEPQFHGFIEDGLPPNHRLACEIVVCDYPGCHELLHNGAVGCRYECNETWIETGNGNFCAPHFIMIWNKEKFCLDDNYAIEIPKVES